MASYAEFRGYPGLVGLFKRLAGFQRQPEFRDMLGKVQSLLDDDYKARVLAGIDSSGNAVPDQAGIRRRRKGKYRGLTGAPGTPRGRASRLYSGYRSTIVQSGNVFTYVGRVDGVPFSDILIKRYRYGGVSPRARRQLTSIVDRAVFSLVRSGSS